MLSCSFKNCGSGAARRSLYKVCPSSAAALSCRVSGPVEEASESLSRNCCHDVHESPITEGYQIRALSVSIFLPFRIARNDHYHSRRVAVYILLLLLLPSLSTVIRAIFEAISRLFAFLADGNCRSKTGKLRDLCYRTPLLITSTHTGSGKIF